MKTVNETSTILFLPISGKEIINIGTSFLLIVLWVYGGLTKFLDYHDSQTQLETAPFIGYGAGIIAWLVPALELATAIFLMFEKKRWLGMLSSLVLLSLLSIYIIAVLTFSDTIPCTCGGLAEWLSWKEQLLINIGFLVIAFIGLLSTKRLTTIGNRDVLDY